MSGEEREKLRNAAAAVIVMRLGPAAAVAHAYLDLDAERQTYTEMKDAYQCMSGRLDFLNARVRELEAALQPFAAVGVAPNIVHIGNEYPVYVFAGDCRKAARVLAGEVEEDPRPETDRLLAHRHARNHHKYECQCADCTCPTTDCSICRNPNCSEPNGKH